ncbi:MAG: hypothetical protein PWQ97_301 [Tepidanaerobacteraceae bacterium]|nr:hypothetical protein [Tepidanaerobacteraceae bacterium]
MKKTLLIGSLVFLLVALLIVGGTMAWFTSEKSVANTFTAGTVKIEVNEHGFEDITNWNPGDTTNKDVSVISEGSKATYVRVSLTPEWLDANGSPTNLSVDNVNLILANNDDWVYSNGWYYYKHILNQNDETSLLLDAVELIGAQTGNDYQGKTLRINVKAEGVQASHEAYKDAWGISSLPAGVKEFTGE